MSIDFLIQYELFSRSIAIQSELYETQQILFRCRFNMMPEQSL